MPQTFDRLIPTNTERNDNAVSTGMNPMALYFRKDIVAPAVALSAIWFFKTGGAIKTDIIYRRTPNLTNMYMLF